MPDKKLTSEEQAALWQLARQGLESKNLKPAISSELANRLCTQLPVQQKDETLGNLIRRASTRTRSMAEVKQFKPKPSKRFKPVAEFMRLAADSHDTEMPLPDPESVLESADSQFRLRVTAINGRIEILIQVLGFAADQFANCCIGLADPGNENVLIAEITLDQDGDGSCQVEDTPRLRRALLKPLIVLVE
jgi:hypothetical protein